MRKVITNSIYENEREKQLVDLAWLAGFFDGEGCVAISKPRGYYEYHGAVTISQQEGIVLEHVRTIAEEQGFPIHEAYRGGYAPNNVLCLRLSNQKGRTFLQKLLPFMHHEAKIARAKFYIKFFSYDGRYLKKGEENMKHTLWPEWQKLRARGEKVSA